MMHHFRCSSGGSDSSSGSSDEISARVSTDSSLETDYSTGSSNPDLPLGRRFEPLLRREVSDLHGLIGSNVSSHEASSSVSSIGSDSSGYSEGSDFDLDSFFQDISDGEVSDLMGLA
jgi:hypothetical protein